MGVVPGFTAEASVYRGTGGCYCTIGGGAPSGTSVRLAQLPTCSGDGPCWTPEQGYLCDCSSGQTCMKRCPIVCRRVCFLWWCWTRCERSELCTVDMFCQ